MLAGERLLRRCGSERSKPSLGPGVRCRLAAEWRGGGERADGGELAGGAEFVFGCFFFKLRTSNEKGSVYSFWVK